VSSRSSPVWNASQEEEITALHERLNPPPVHPSGGGVWLYKVGGGRNRISAIFTKKNSKKLKKTIKKLAKSKRGPAST
jgi:hypothetical protein